MTDLGLVLVVILIVAIIWRGPKTLPRLGEALGRGVREARREASDVRDDVRAKADASGWSGGRTDDEPAAVSDDRRAPDG